MGVPARKLRTGSETSSLCLLRELLVLLLELGLRALSELVRLLYHICAHQLCPLLLKLNDVASSTRRRVQITETHLSFELLQLFGFTLTSVLVCVYGMSCKAFSAPIKIIPSWAFSFLLYAS